MDNPCGAGLTSVKLVGYMWGGINIMHLFFRTKSLESRPTGLAFPHLVRIEEGYTESKVCILVSTYIYIFISTANLCFGLGLETVYTYFFLFTFLCLLLVQILCFGF